MLQGAKTILPAYITGIWNIKTGRQLYPAAGSVHDDASSDDNPFTDDEIRILAGIVAPQSSSSDTDTSAAPKMLADTTEAAGNGTQPSDLSDYWHEVKDLPVLPFYHARTTNGDHACLSSFHAH